MDVTIYHSPECGTSRNVCALIRNAGIEPAIIEYLKTPPARPVLVSLIARTGRGFAFGINRPTLQVELGEYSCTLEPEQVV
jgi:arsenate reductase (glutaredoxin)